jgi:hypothetical protein
MTYHKLTYVFQSVDGGRKLNVISTDYHSAYKEVMNILPGARLVDLVDTVVIIEVN